MAIEVTRETDEQIKEMGWLGKFVERCEDCQKPTRYWAYGGKFPLCPPCAEKRPGATVDDKE
jgi:hypothetical protein